MSIKTLPPPLPSYRNINIKNTFIMKPEKHTTSYLMLGPVTAGLSLKMISPCLMFLVATRYLPISQSCLTLNAGQPQAWCWCRGQWWASPQPTQRTNCSVARQRKQAGGSVMIVIMIMIMIVIVWCYPGTDCHRALTDADIEPETIRASDCR